MSTTSLSTSTPSASARRAAMRVARGRSSGRPGRRRRRVPASAAPRRPGRRARAARTPGVQSRAPRDVVVVGGDVGRGRRHRGPVGRRIRHRCDPAVVGDVEPLVSVRRPRVGPLDARDAARGARAGRRPQAEGAVDVAPGARARAASVDDLGERIERAGVDLAGLRADDRAGRRGARSATRARTAIIRPWSSAATDADRSAPSRASGRPRSTVTWACSPATTRTSGAPCRPSASTSQPASRRTRVARRGQAGEVRHLAARSRTRSRSRRAARAARAPSAPRPPPRPTATAPTTYPPAF